MKRVMVTALVMLMGLAITMQAAPGVTVDTLDLGVASWGLGADDFNRDGKLDFVNRGTDGSVYLFLNNGNGTFTKSIIASGILNDGGDMSTGDFNSDGWPDIVYSNFSDTLYILLNSHDNSFNPTVFPTGRGELIGVDCGDFDNDGHQDIFVISYNSKIVLIARGNGLGNFVVVDTFVADPEHVMTGGVPSVVAGDFDKDGFLDLVSGQDDDDRPGDAWFYKGDGTGHFTYGGLSYDTNPLASSGMDQSGGGTADAFDFDRDGNLDIFYASTSSYPWSGTAAIFKGNGTPFFGSADSFIVKPYPMNASAVPTTGFSGRETFGVSAGPFSNWGVIVWFNRNALVIPSVVYDSVCDTGHVMQPVQVSLSQPIKGTMISLKIPAGVSDVMLSRAGLPTESWNLVSGAVDSAAGVMRMLLANTHGYRIPVGTTTLFNILFRMQRLCGVDQYLHWDTASSGDISRKTTFGDTLGNVFEPIFDRDRDSSTVPGYLAGDADGSGSVDIADIFALIDYLVPEINPCLKNAMNVDGKCAIDIGDVFAYIDYLVSGVPLQCTAPCAPGMAKVATPSDEVTVSASFANGVTTISTLSEKTLRGLQLFLTGNGSDEAISLMSKPFDVKTGRVGDEVRVLALDFKGRTRIEPGTNAVLKLNGEYKLTRAVVGDDQGNSIEASVGSAAKPMTLPKEFALSQNYPNPFNPTTTISFSLPTAGDYKLTIYNVAGQMVKEFTGNSEAGEVTLTWDGTGMASGVYLYRLSVGGFSATKKMILLK